MFSGQVAQISNQATWQSDIVYVVDEDDGTPIDLSGADAFAVTISELRGVSRADDWWGSPAYPIVTADLDNDKVSFVGNGFRWQFEVEDLENIGAGTYCLGVKVTIDGFVVDLIRGTVVVRKSLPLTKRPAVVVPTPTPTPTPGAISNGALIALIEDI